MQTKARSEVDENEDTRPAQTEGKVFGRYSLLRDHFAEPSMTDKHPILEITQLSLQQIDRQIKTLPDDSNLDDYQKVDVNGKDVPACTVSARIEFVKRSFTGEDPDDQTEQLEFVIRRKARIRRLDQTLVLRFDESVRIDIFSLLQSSGREIWKAQHDGRIRETGVSLPDGVHANLTFTINIRNAVLSVISDRFHDENINESISLEATWERLPRCPESTHLLDVSAPLRYRKLFRKQLGIALSMAWTDASAVSKSGQSSDRFKLADPEAAESQDDLAPRYRLTFLIHASYVKRLIQNDLTCPLCRDGKHFRHFHSLQLHLVAMHRRFHFQTEDDHSAHRLFTVSKIIHMSLREAPAPATTPSRIDSDIEETEVYSKRSNGIRHVQLPQTKRGRGRPRKHPQLQYQARKPKDVPDIPPRIREKHPVPRVKDSLGNNINFYRTGSKRPLQAGEEIVDSDNDIDDDWLEHKQLENLKKFRYKNAQGMAAKLSAGVIEFMADFNSYIDYEERLGSSGDVLKRDAIVRFARKFRHKHVNEDWRRQFRAKLERLQMHAVIDEETMVYCMAPIEPETDPSDEEELNGQPETPRAHRRSSRITDAMQLDSEDHDQDHIVESSGNELSESDGVTANNNKQVVDSDTSEGSEEDPVDSDDSIDQSEANESPAPEQSTIGASKAQSDEPQSEPEPRINGTNTLSPARGRLTNGNTEHGEGSARKVNGIGDRYNRYNLDEDTETSTTLRDFCICGKRVYGVNETVFCVGPDCKRERFHPDCVGVPSEKQGWRCSACRSSSV